jgi:transcription antitermination protein NusB
MNFSRRKGRELALQCIYALEQGADSYPLVEDACIQALSVNEDDKKFSRMLVELTRHNKLEIEEKMVSELQNWDIDRMNLLDKILVRLALAEILFHPETPTKVVLSEALQLAKKYSGSESSKFVNGILDAVLRKAQILK